MHPSFCPKTSGIIVQAAKEANLENVIKEKGTIVTVEGPRFSSRAESFMFKSWKAGMFGSLKWQLHSFLLKFISKPWVNPFLYWHFLDVLSMTTCPEVVLAKEAGISYASIAMVCLKTWPKQNFNFHEKIILWFCEICIYKKKIILLTIFFSWNRWLIMTVGKMTLNLLMPNMCSKLWELMLKMSRNYWWNP